jgi:hypothetical protein
MLVIVAREVSCTRKQIAQCRAGKIEELHECLFWLCGAQTLAYLLPVLSRALQSAEAEFEALAAKGQQAKAGALQVTSASLLANEHTLLRSPASSLSACMR